MLSFAPQHQKQCYQLIINYSVCWQLIISLTLFTNRCTPLSSAPLTVTDDENMTKQLV